MKLNNFVAVLFASLLTQASPPPAFAGQPIPPSHVDDFHGRPRLIVISDIGNEPDDQMSLARLLLYSNGDNARAHQSVRASTTELAPMKMTPDRGSVRSFRISSTSFNRQRQLAESITMPLGRADIYSDNLTARRMGFKHRAA